MSYVIAAYTVTIAGILGYAGWLALERQRIQSDLARGDARDLD